MRKISSPVFWLIAAIFPVTIFAADKIPLRLAIEPGMSWSFDESQENASDNKATANGQSQSFSTKMHGHRSGKIEVLTVKNGIPSSLKVTYDDGCETVNESNGQQFKAAFPYSG
jgi:hypothetical protein